MSGTEYQKLLDAVENYYGSGSDEWIEIAKYGLSADNCTKILKQTPGVSTVISKDGSRVLSYTVGDTASLATQGASAVINSNAQVATLSKTATLNYPAQMTVDSAGTVITESGMKAVSSGASVKTVLGNVATGVAAVGCGVQLGALIDQTLYDINPDFWDDHNMSSLNPQTWDSLCSTQGGKDVFNMVFGINKDTGKTQSYIDQNALAYICQYLVSKNAFDESTTYEVQDQSILFNPNSYSNVNFPYSSPWTIVFTNRTETYKVSNNTSDVKICFCKYNNNDEYGDAYFISENPFDLTCITKSELGTDEFSWSGYIHDTTRDDKTFYYITPNSFRFSYLVSVLNPVYCPNLYHIGWDLGYYAFYGIPHTSSGIDGITHQMGATVPSGITKDMTIPEVISKLKTLYPSLFDNAIYNDVVQEDGSTERIIYLPVAIPDSVPLDDVTGKLKPTGGVDLSQDNSIIDDSSPDDLTKTLLEIISTPDPYDPTKIPTDTDPNAPDVGKGTTPIVTPITGSASSLYAIYNPTLSEINNFGAWLWSDSFIEQIKKLFNDPMQAIIGLHKVYATPITGGSQNIKVGYLDSGVSSKIVTNQYTTIDCGTVSCVEYFGNVFDYSPYTNISLYLPFIGIVNLDTADIMRSSIQIIYHVDVLTGACLAEVKVTRDNAGGTLYQYAGNSAVTLPISSGSYMGIVASLASIAGSVAGTIASGGAAAPMLIGAAGSALNAHTQVEHSGGFSGNAGAMGGKIPYLIISRPQTEIAENYESYIGNPSNHTVTLGSCSGYVQVKECHLENIPATQNELNMLESLLKGGVLL